MQLGVHTVPVQSHRPCTSLLSLRSLGRLEVKRVACQPFFRIKYSRRCLTPVKLREGIALTLATLPDCSPPEVLHRKRVPPRIAVFLSGGGSNFRSIYNAITAGEINAEVAVVVSDVPKCGGWQFARQEGIPTEAFPASAKTAEEGKCIALSTEELVEALTERYDVDYVLLAGYLKLIPEALVRQYKRAMLNIHPALLPNFGGKGLYGLRVHKAVIASGARFSGPTIHFVDEGYDTGPILAQSIVPVYPTDTPAQLAARVLREEHKLYPEAVSALVDQRITWRHDGIPVMWTAH